MIRLIDAVESWLASQSFWVQAPILLAVLIPLCWLIAGGIDSIVDRILGRHTRREARSQAQTLPGGRP